MNCEKIFRCKPGRTVHLDKMPTVPPHDYDQNKLTERAAENARQLELLQYKLFAENKQSLLIILQALDAGGKDGTVRHVLGTLNPQSCRCCSFKVPSELERAHDFLWRIHREAPRTGEVVIFNRSHYEDVLVPRVHQTIDRAEWKRRCERINRFENMLAEGGTRIVKFFLNISPEEQFRRLTARLDDPAKQWKVCEADFAEREHFGEYLDVASEVIARCGEAAPWYVIPADNKAFRNYAVSEILDDIVSSMKIQLPAPVADIEALKRKYVSAPVPDKKKK